jgi:hypothetical protein
MATHDLELNMSADVILTMAAMAIAYLAGANRVLREQANQRSEPIRIELETMAPKKRGRRKRLPAPPERKQLPPGDA